MRRAALAAVFITLQAGASCLTPQWARVNVAAGLLRPGDTAVADFDGDGKREIATITSTAISSIWSRVAISRNFEPLTTIYTGSNMVGRIFASDVNRDSRADIVVAEKDAKTIVVLTGRANGTFNTPITTSLPGTPIALTVADMNKDQRPDVVVYEDTTKSLLVMKGDGAGKFTQVENLPLPDPAYVMTAADLDNDGALDLVIGHFQFDELTLLFGNGDGTFGAAAAIETGNWPAGVAAGDLDGDTFADLVTADYADGKISVHLSDGGDNFENPVRYNVATNPSAVAIADLTGDGKLDIAVATLNGNKAMSFTNNGNGTFRAPVSAACDGCHFVGITAADINGDNRVDVVGGSGSVIVFDNKCGASNVNLVARTPVINALENATFDITVTGVVPDAPIPTGTITLKKGTQTVAFAPLGAQITLHELAAGTHEITAHYGGNAEYTANVSSPVTVTVNALPTTTTISRSPETTVAGQPVTITAEVSAKQAATLLVVERNGVEIAQSAGRTIIINSPLEAGTYTFRAHFPGDAVYAASQSDTITHVVTKATPTVTGTPLAPTSTGQLATFTARVTPPYVHVPAGGTVRLLEGSTVLATATLGEDGVALLRTAALTEGTHQLRVAYDGDANFNAAESAAFSFTVSPYVPGRKRRSAGH